MPPELAVPLALVAAYLVGSVDFAVVVGRMHGVDIRQVGSGNPGASNVMRTMGRFPAAMVLVGDLMKGVIGAAMGTVAVSSGDPQGVWVLATGMAAVVGHCYPVFHHFQGGKGVATAAGVLLFVMPLGALALALVFAVVVTFTRVASVGSLLVAALAVPTAVWRGVPSESMWVLGAMVVLIGWRHRGNIQRMLGGGERKVIS